MKKMIMMFVFGFMIFPQLVYAQQVRYTVTARCQSNYNYDFVYDNPKGYTCSNGNSSPYTKTIEDTCKILTQNVCNVGTTKKCYITLDYDCSKTTSGAKYVTTTKKTTTKRRSTTTSTTTTTVAVKSNTKLKSLSLSSGSIVFNSDTYEYSINVESNIDSIDVTAIPEDDNPSFSLPDEIYPRVL